jgi:hypothetical protein
MINLNCRHKTQTWISRMHRIEFYILTIMSLHVNEKIELS